MLKNKKLTGKVWYLGDLWKVHTVMSPTKYDDYLILSRPVGTSIHEDGSTPIEMVMIDAHNSEFFPNNAKISKIMRRRAAVKYQEAGKRRSEDQVLTEEWLNLFPRSR